MHKINIYICSFHSNIHKHEELIFNYYYYYIYQIRFFSFFENNLLDNRLDTNLKRNVVDLYVRISTQVYFSL